MSGSWHGSLVFLLLARPAAAAPVLSADLRAAPLAAPTPSAAWGASASAAAPSVLGVSPLASAVPPLPTSAVSAAPIESAAPAESAAPTQPAASALDAARAVPAAAAADAGVEASAAALDAAFSGSARRGAPSAIAQLVDGGYRRREASRLVGRVQERLERLAAFRKQRPETRPRPVLKQAFLLTVLLGVRPGSLLYLDQEQLETFRQAVRWINPRIEIVTQPRPRGMTRAFVFDPDLAMESMRRATETGQPEVSFARDLAWIGTGAHSRRRLLRWLREHAAEFMRAPEPDHRLGVLFGYPPNDVAHLVGDAPSSRESDWVRVLYAGDEANALFWMARDARAPATRRAAATYRAVLDLAAERLEDR